MNLIEKSHQGISNIKPRPVTLYSVFRSCYGKAYTKPDWRGPATQYSGCSSCFTSSRRISDSGQVFSVSPWRIARLVLPNFIPPRRGPEPAPRHRSRSRGAAAGPGRLRHQTLGPGPWSRPLHIVHRFMLYSVPYFLSRRKIWLVFRIIKYTFGVLQDPTLTALWVE